ncbi:uncharacterized protein LOC123310017 [Coccinella septempunctata]|uniref:uncharacterized protein LOC123310017 n=1 Tax=Coccinella septempunctata TaxID=41139 RepID=UPI001D08CD4C|nr:uncharacterized protein LOC123310017 [Coccinella septempunctata]
MKNSKWHLHLLLLLFFESGFISTSDYYDVDKTIKVDLSYEGKTASGFKQFLKDALEKCDLIPGKYVELLITPPEGAEIDYTENLIKVMEDVLPSYMNATDTVLKITSVVNDISDFLEDIKVDIISGFADAKSLYSDIQRITEPYVLKIVSMYDEFHTKLTAILEDAIASCKHCSDAADAISFILNLDLPNGTTHDYVDQILDYANIYLKEKYSAFAIDKIILENRDGTMRNAQLLVKLLPNAQNDVTKLKLDLSSGDVDTEILIQRLISKSISIDVESRCEPIDIQVIPDKKGEKAIEDIKRIFQKVLQAFSPEKKYIITQLTAETNIENTFALQIECPRAKSVNDRKLRMRKRSLLFGFKNEIIIDLTRPGVSVETDLQKSIPQILSKIQAELKTSNYVSLSFSVRTPPKQGSGYIRIAQNELLLALKKYFKDCQINVAARPLIGFGGFLSQIVFDVSLEQRMSGGSILGNGIEILLDLFSPGINVISEVRTIILNLLPKITADIRLGKTVSFSLKVRPPKSSNSGFLQKMQDKIRLQLKTYFPNCGISVSPKNNNVGNGDYLIFLVELQPFYNIATTPPTGNFEINLETPGASLESQISIHLPSVLPKLQNLLDSNKPASLSLSVKPPRNFGSNYISLIKHQLTVIMQRKIPNRKISIIPVKENPSEISFNVNILPKLDDSNFPSIADINLGIKGIDLKKEINAFLSNLPPNFQKNLDRRIPQTFEIVVETSPSEGTPSIDRYLEEIKEILNKRFPSCYISISGKVESGLQPNTIMTIFEVLLQPGRKDQVAFLPGSWLKNKLDFNGDINGLISEIQFILKNTSSAASQQLKQNKTVGFSYEIVIEEDTTKIDLEVIASTILSQLIDVFPDFRLDTTINCIEDTENFIKKGEINILIQPEQRNEDVQWVSYPNRFVLELFREGATVDSQMKKVIAQLFGKIGGDSNKDDSHIVQFLIKPPKNSDEKFMYFTSDRIMDNLCRYFPEYFIEIISNAIMGDQNSITEIVLNVRLYPGRTPEEISISTGESPGIFELDVTKTTGSPIVQIGIWMQSNLGRIITELKSKPVILIFNIEPIENSRIEYQIMKLNEIKELILNLFINHNIRFEVRGVQDRRGFVKRTDVVVKIQPNFKEMTDTGFLGGILWDADENSFQIERPPRDLTWDMTIRNESVCEMTIRPDDNIAMAVDSEIRKILIDIRNALKVEKMYQAGFLLQFPGGISKQKLQFISKLMVEHFEHFNDNYIFKTNILDEQIDKDSVTKAKIIVDITSPKRTEIHIGSAEKGQNILEAIKQKLAETKKKMMDSLNQGQKADIVLNFSKPKSPSSKFVEETLAILDQELSVIYPDIEHILSIESFESSSFSVKVTLKGSLSQILPPKKSTHFNVWVGGPGATPEKRIEDTLNSWSPILKTFLDDRRKLTFVMDIDLTTESNEAEVRKIMENLKASIKRRFPTTCIGITPFLSRNLDKSIYKIEFEVDIESYIIDGSSAVENIVLDLSNPSRPIKSQLKETLPNIIRDVQKHLDQMKPTVLNLNIRPPEESTENFMDIISEVIAPSLTSPFCGCKKNWMAKPDFDFNGYLIDISMSITFEPSKRSKLEKPTQCAEDIDIDLTKPGSKLEVEFDRIFPTMFTEVQVYLEQGKTVTLVFQLALPPNSALKQISESLMGILQNYFPYNEVSIAIQQKSDNVKSSATLTVTVLPEKDPLPSSNIDIPLDLSQAYSVQFSLAELAKMYKSRLHALLQQQSTLTVGLRINPPRGVGDNFLETLTTYVMEAINGVIKNKTIQVQSKAAKNSKGAYIKIRTVITIS